MASACLIFNFAIVWLRMDIGSKLQEKRQQMIESYLSDADTTSEQKLPIIDQFFT